MSATPKKPKCTPEQKAAISRANGARSHGPTSPAGLARQWPRSMGDAALKGPSFVEEALRTGKDKAAAIAPAEEPAPGETAPRRKSGDLPDDPSSPPEKTAYPFPNQIFASRAQNDDDPSSPAPEPVAGERLRHRLEAIDERSGPQPDPPDGAASGNAPAAAAGARPPP